MARLVTSGAEQNSTTTGDEIDGGTGLTNLSVVTSGARSGTYEWQVSTSAAQCSARFFVLASAASSKGYARGYFKFTSFPASTVLLFWFTQGSNTLRSGVQITSAGKLQLVDSTGAQVGSDSPALVTGRRYRVEIHNDGGAAKAIEARLQDCGTSGDDFYGAAPTFASGTNTGTVTWSRVAFGFNGTNVTATYVVDDIVVNDDSGTAQNTWPGSGKIGRYLPNATGDVNGFLVNVGGTAGAGNNFTRVNEISQDDSSTYNASAVLNAEDLYNVANPGLGTANTINVVLAGGQFANTVSADATAAFKFELEKTASGTLAQSAAIIPNSTTFVTNSFATTSASQYPLTLYKDPDNTAWTPPVLDTIQIGFKETTANVQSIAISANWMLVDYTPQPVAKPLSALGVG